MGTLKGQNFRLLTYDAVAAKWSVIGMSTGCTITLNTTADDSSTKNDVGMAAKPVITAKSWQVSVDTLNVIDAAAMLTAIKSLTPFTLMWDETSTVDNQTPEGAAFARKGTAFLSDLTLTFNNREKAAKNLQFSGSGAISAADATIETASVAAGTGLSGSA